MLAHPHQQLGAPLTASAMWRSILAAVGSLLRGPMFVASSTGSSSRTFHPAA